MNPWEMKYQKQPAVSDEDGPWNKTWAKPPSTSDQVMDFVQGVGGGLQKGVLGVAGLPADIAGGLQSALDWGRSKVQGRPLAEVKAESEAAAIIPRASLERYGGQGLVQGYRDSGGEIYEPKHFAGRVASAIGEFAPIAALPIGNAGMLARLGMGAALPGAASASVTEATGSPLAGAAAAFASPIVAARLVTPVRGVQSATRDQSLAALADEGVTSLTAGQRTGSRPLQWVESVVGDSIGAGGGATRLATEQGEQLTRAAARRMGADTDQLLPETFQRTRDQLGGNFRRLSAQYNLDAQAGNLTPRIAGAIQNHVQDMTPENQRRFMNIITDRIVPNMQGGQMPGARYQALRSSLSNIAKGASQDRPFQLGVRQLRNALDDAMGDTIAATGNPADAALWRTTREQWGSMRTLQDAMDRAGPVTASGALTPANLRSAAAKVDEDAYARGTGNLNPLARAAVEVMTPLPQSGTGPREAARAVMMAGGAALGNQAAGAPGGMLGALAPLIGPAIAGRAIMSGPGQAWLGNRALPNEYDTFIQALLRARQDGIQ